MVLLGIIIVLASFAVSFAGVCGDINGDAFANVADAVYMINYVFKGGPAPDCGPEMGTVTDIDGNIYHTIKIGDQWWMMENLKVTHYRNGDPIPNVPDYPAWMGLTTGAYCEYNNDINNVAAYGRLYNWYTVGDSRNIAPAGWHVPSDAEWQTLVDYLGGEAVAGGKMKEAGTAHWNSPNTGATNESGFTALPGGYRFGDGGDYSDMGYNVFFWSTTERDGYLLVWTLDLNYSSSGAGRGGHTKPGGLTVRCVKD